MRKTTKESVKSPKDVCVHIKSIHDLMFTVAKYFVGMTMLTVVPLMPIIRLVFQEQPSAFVLTFSNAMKTQQNPSCGAAVAVEGHCIERIE